MDTGMKLHSPSTELMKLVNIHNDAESTSTDFTMITTYIQEHLYDIIYDIHHTYDKLLIDNGQVQINCPPSVEKDAETTDSAHSTLLLHTLSEQEATNGGITAKREIKVYDCGPDPDNNDTKRMILIREDTVQASHDMNDPHPLLNEQSVTIPVQHKKF